MIKYLKTIFLKVFITIHVWLIRLGIAMKNTEDDVLKGDNNQISEKGKNQIRQTHRNPVIEKMLQGQRDEQYVKDYYEILRKADHFMRTASPEKIAMAADKYGMSYGKKDRWGRRFEHFGFFDPKHKNYGKTLAEAMKDEVEEKRVKDDKYQIEFIFDNKPIVLGLASFSELKESKSENVSSGVEVMSEFEKAKTRRFPMTVIRENRDVANKIEQITRYLHVKKRTDTLKVLEFFIPKKFKLADHVDDKEIMDELTNIKQVWIKDEYDGKYGYTITEFKKYIDHDDQYDVLKFSANKIINLDDI